MKPGSNEQTYIVQDACVNCDHAFRKQDYDSEDTYYCARDRNKVIRPLCGSVLMQEDKSRFYTSKAYDRWLNWANYRRVSAVGKCRYWTLTQRG